MRWPSETGRFAKLLQVFAEFLVRQSRIPHQLLQQSLPQVFAAVNGYGDQESVTFSFHDMVASRGADDRKASALEGLEGVLPADRGKLRHSR